MSLEEYFQNTEGVGILGTADAAGNVDMAVYSRPHIIDETTIAFIMRQRLSYANLQSNPKAAYLFTEKGEGYNGKRLYLTKTREESDSDVIASYSRKKHVSDDSTAENRYLVYFTIEKERPLVGG
ncbi:MAG: pyridoxamine 5'-phosphate oxidase family protein [Sedimentisphaerales bacterium]|nr:pyridoxamine 5'-phosphate oxidase family protein [Sedimentisphaerales bacterium]